MKWQIHPPGEHLMLMEVAFKAGGIGESHSHPHEQISYCLKGKVAFHIDGETLRIHAGQSVVIPSHTEHGVTALEDNTLRDAFTPLRQDLLNT